jgi:hypothetical protein
MEGDGEGGEVWVERSGIYAQVGMESVQRS